MKASFPPKVSPVALKSKVSVLRSSMLTLTLLGFSHLHGQTISWGNTGGSTAWYTAANWSPSTASGAWTTSNVAQFQNTGTASTSGINMGTSALSIGAIEVTSVRTRTLTIGNSSGTSGNVTLNGATLTSVSNVVLRNASGSTLTLQNNETGSGKTMEVVLGNSTDNRLLLDGSGNIVISSVISGTARPLSVSGSGSGQLTLSNSNTYSGNTTLHSGGRLAVINTTGSATGSGNVQANTGSVILGTGFVSPAAGGSITVSSGAKVSVGNSSGDVSGKILTFTPASGSIATTFETGSTLEFDLFSGAGLGDQSSIVSSSDLFRTGGSFNIQSGVKLRVSSSMTGFAANDRWRLFDWTTLGGNAPSGTFESSLMELPALTSGLEWNLSQLQTFGTLSVTAASFAAVPEPNRAVFMLLGSCIAIFRRKR